MAIDGTRRWPIGGEPAARWVMLNDGRRIPRIGFGTCRLEPGHRTRDAVVAALKAGYRHVDTAAAYQNEADVGAAVRAAGVPRGDIWITTKLWNDDHGGDRPLHALEASLRRLGMEYVDLWLMHWPVPDRLQTWRTMRRARAEGLTRSIGVSNFLASHLAEIVVDSDCTPAVDQIELSPFLFGTRADTVSYARQRGIVIEASGPLTKGRRLRDPLVATIAASHGVSAAQVLLRWSVQRGFVPLPRSSIVERIRANLDLGGFALTEREMAELDALNGGLGVRWRADRRSHPPTAGGDRGSRSDSR